jgi:hypothetical protein
LVDLRVYQILRLSVPLLFFEPSAFKLTMLISRSCVPRCLPFYTSLCTLLPTLLRVPVS